MQLWHPSIYFLQSIPFGFEEVAAFDFVHFHSHIERTLSRVVTNISEGKGVVIRGPKGRNKTTTMKYFALLLGRFVAHYALHGHSGTDNLDLVLAVTMHPLDLVCVKLPGGGIAKSGARDFFQQLTLFQNQVWVSWGRNKEVKSSI